MGQDMEKYLKDEGRPYSIDRVKEIGGQLISGIRYLHEKGIVHQDLKPSNILFSSDFEKVKLTDLGVSNRLDKTREFTAANQGTIRYMPPEQLNSQLSFKTDIWAFGCVLLQFATGIKPFGDENDFVIPYQISFQKISPLDYALKHFSEDDLELI